MDQTRHRRDVHAREDMGVEDVHITTKAPKPGFHGSLVWECSVTGCREAIQFTQEGGDVIAFLLVHHLVHKHGFTKQDVLAYDARLKDASVEYLGFPENRG